VLLPRRLASAIVVVVSIVWVVNFGAQFFIPTYHPDISINGIFMAVVGGGLMLARKGKGAGNDRDGDDRDDPDDDGPLSLPFRLRRDDERGARREQSPPHDRREPDRRLPPRRYYDDDDDR
jgi:hypothetical protein